MTKRHIETLNGLSKEQLIYLIEQLVHSQHLISSVCVRESKKEIDSAKAVDKIRNYLYDMPGLYDATEVKAYIDKRIKSKSDSHKLELSKEFIEKELNVPITMVSNGPGRHEIIHR